MKLLVESDPLRIRIALLEDERLVELHVDGRHPSRVGEVHLGRVQRIAPAIDAAFVDIGGRRKAFLHADDFALAEGERLELHQPLIVQVFRDEVPGKGPRVRRGASLPGRYLVLLAPGEGVAISTRIDDLAERERLSAAVADGGSDGVGWIVRTAAVGVGEREIKAEAAALLDIWLAIERTAAISKPSRLLHSDLDSLERWLRDRIDDSLAEIWVDSPALEQRMHEALEELAPEMRGRVSLHDQPVTLFERFGVEAQIEALWDRRVGLPAGGSLVIESTEALVAIDVNSGRDLGANSLEETALATNLEAAVEAARQIRLRDLAGIIVVDFIDMYAPGSWEQVVEALESELGRDRATTVAEGPVGPGLVAITRKRSRAALLRRLSIDCPECGGAGRLRSPLEVVAAARRALLARASVEPRGAWRLLLHPSVVAVSEERAAPLLEDLRRRLGGRLEIGALETLSRAEFEIVEVLS